MIDDKYLVDSQLQPGRELTPEEKLAALDAKIAERVAAYRKLSQQADDLKAQMEAHKAELMTLVEARGESWKDDKGYARIVDKAAAYSYPSSAVDDLAVTWAGSDNDIMKSCGQMLLKKRTLGGGSHYIQIH